MKLNVQNNNSLPKQETNLRWRTDSVLIVTNCILVVRLFIANSANLSQNVVGPSRETKVLVFHDDRLNRLRG